MGLWEWGGEMEKRLVGDLKSQNHCVIVTVWLEILGGSGNIDKFLLQDTAPGMS